MFPNHIIYQLVFYNILGFCTELSEISLNHRTRKRSTVIFVIHLLFLCMCVTLIGHFKPPSSLTKTKMDLLTVINDGVKVFSSVIVYYFVIVESYTKRHVQQQFWKIYIQINRDQCNQNHANAMFRNYFKKFLLFFLFAIGMEMTVFLQISAKEFAITFVYIILVTMHQTRVFYYLFYVELLHYELKAIKNDLKEMADASARSILMVTDNEWEIEDRILCEKFKRLRKNYSLVYTLANCMNEVFGWSHLASIMYYFLLLLADLNYAYWHLYTNRNLQIRGLFGIVNC